MQSSLANFGNHENQYEDILKLIIQYRENKPYACCYLFALSESLKSQIQSHPLANRYVINDTFPSSHNESKENLYIGKEDIVIIGLFDQPNLILQENLKNFITQLDKNQSNFIMFYGALGIKNDYPISWSQGHIVRLSYSSELGEYLEHLYLSSSLANYFTQHLPEHQGSLQPLFYRLFETQAIEEPAQYKNGKRTALVWEETNEEKRMSYSELNRAANRLAHYLLKKGLEKKLAAKEEPLVALYLNRSPNLIIAILALMKIGVAYLPLETNQERLSLEACRERIQQSGSCLLMTHPALAQQLNITSVSILPIEEDDFNLAKLTAELTESKEAHPNDNPCCPVTGNNLAYVMYTSGSTGVPKGVEILQRGLPFAFESHQDLLNLGPEDRVMQFSSIGWDPSVMEIMMALGSGAELHLVNDETYRNSELLAAFLKNHKITVAIQTPKMLAELKPEKFPDLRCLLIVGDSFPKELSDQWIVPVKANNRTQLRQVVNGYGLTETTICTTLELCAKNKPLTIGKPILGLETFLRHLDENDYSEEKIEQPILTNENWLSPIYDIEKEGELYIAGPCLARGYWQNPALTQERFILESSQQKILYRSGDKAKYTPSGYLAITGRVDRQVKIAGQRTELGEIEKRLEKQEKISEIRVLAYTPSVANLSKSLTAFIVPKDKTVLNDQAIRSLALRDILESSKEMPTFMHPALIRFLEQLPRKDNDKKSVDDKALQKYFKMEKQQTEENKIEVAQIKTKKNKKHKKKNKLVQNISIKKSHLELEIWLRKIYAEQLGLEEGVIKNFDFASLGGDSLKIRQCIEVLHQRAEEQPTFQKEMKLLAIKDLTNSTVSDLLNILKNKKRNDEKEKKEKKEELQELSENITNPIQSTKILMLEYMNLSLNREKIYGKIPIPFYCIHSLLGDAELDYRGTELQQLKVHCNLLSTPPAETLREWEDKNNEEKKPTSFIDPLVNYHIGQIKKIYKTGSYWLLGWSSGGLIALKIAEKLRSKGEQVFVFVLDTVHPQLIKDSPLPEQEKILTQLNKKIQEGLASYDINFALPKKVKLNEKNQIKNFFSEIEFLFNSFFQKNQNVPKDKIDLAKKLILSAKMIYQSELFPESRWPDLNQDDILITTNESVKKFKSDSLGWKANCAPIILDTNHFDLLKQPRLSDEINKQLIKQFILLETAYCSGVACLIEKKWEESIKYFDQAIQLNLNHVNAYVNRATAKSQLNNYKDSIADYDLAIQLDPKNEVAYFNRSNTQLISRCFQEAIAGYNRVIELDDKNIGAYHNRGLAKSKLCRAKGAIGDFNFEEAIKDFNQVIKLDPKNVSAYINRGITKSYLYNYQEAIEDFNQALLWDPNNASIYLGRGIAKSASENFKAAIEDFNQAIQLEPNNVTLYQCRSRAQSELKLFQDHNDIIAYHNQGMAKLKLNFFQDASKDFSQIIKLDPKNVAAYQHRGLMKCKLKCFKEAIEDFDKALQLDPNNADTYDLRGTANLEFNLQDAIKDFNQVIRLDPKNVNVYRKRALAHFQLKHFQDAITDYNRAIQLDPKNVNLYFFNRGSAKFQLNRFQEAIADFNQLIENDPSNSLAYYYRGKAKLKLNQFQGAIEDFNQAIQLDPNNMDVYLEENIARLKLKHLQQAIKDRNRTTQPNLNKEDYFNRGNFKLASGHFQDAIVDYNQVIKLDPKNVAAYTNRAYANLKLGHYQTAINDSNQIIELDPKNARAYLTQGLVQEKLNNSLEAIKYFYIAIQYSKDQEDKNSMRKAKEVILSTCTRVKNLLQQSSISSWSSCFHLAFVQKEMDLLQSDLDNFMGAESSEENKNTSPPLPFLLFLHSVYLKINPFFYKLIKNNLPNLWSNRDQIDSKKIGNMSQHSPRFFISEEKKKDSLLTVSPINRLTYQKITQDRK